MPHRIHRFASRVLFACCLLCMGLAGARADERILRFEGIESYMNAHSPRLEILARQLDAAVAEADDSLRWSNPELAYDVEDFDLYREWQLTLQKRFEMPLRQSALRESWRAHTRSAELRAEQATAELLAELKGGYVRLQSLDAQLTRLEELAELVALASEIANERLQAGELSAVESKLIQLSSLSLASASRRVHQERREFGSRWRVAMGARSTDSVTLATATGYQRVELASDEELAAQLPMRPGLRGQEERIHALSRRAAAARPSLLPSVGLHGGYKDVDGGVNGYVAGISLGLPLFDRKAGASRRHEAESRIAERQLEVERTRLQDEIRSLHAAISDAQRVLETFAGHFEEGEPLADTLLFSYREGSLSLDAFLNAIQVESSALDDYYAELDSYYQNLFRLESITGVTMVQFDD